MQTIAILQFFLNMLASKSEDMVGKGRGEGKGSKYCSTTTPILLHWVFHQTLLWEQHTCSLDLWSSQVEMGKPLSWGRYITSWDSSEDSCTWNRREQWALVLQRWGRWRLLTLGMWVCLCAGLYAPSFVLVAYTFWSCCSRTITVPFWTVPFGLACLRLLVQSCWLEELT